jgi:hypothetical protein
MSELIIFFIRYIPFWAVPVIIISLPFAYVFWLKEIRLLTYFFIMTSFVALLFIAFWVWQGGPDKAVEFYFNAVRNF